MIKKTLIGLAAAMAIAVVAPAWADVTVDVNGQPVAFDQPPIMQGGRVLVPLRGVFEKLGATVQYNAAARNIVAQSGATSIALQIGSTAATVNGQQQSLDAPPILVGGRAMVPLRFVSQALGAQVSWNESQQLVAITAGGAMPPSESYNPPPQPAHPHLQHGWGIALVQLDNGHLRDRKLHAGDTFNVRMTGMAGSKATFDVGDHRGLPMREGPAGTYTAQYTIRQADMGRKPKVTFHLTMPDGQRTSRTADETLALDAETRPGVPAETATRPAAPAVAQNQRSIIHSAVHNGSGTLEPGQTLEVTMVGVPKGTATFDVGSHRGLPMTEASPGTYVGRFQVPKGEANSHAEIVAHLTPPDGPTTSLPVPPSVSIR